MENEMKLLKSALKSFLSDAMDINEISEDIDNSNTFQELKYVLSEYSEEIVKALDYECPSCDKKDDEIRDLESDVDTLEDDIGEYRDRAYDAESELSDYKSKSPICPEDLNDVFKFEAFMKNKDRFSVSEFESLFD